MVNVHVGWYGWTIGYHNDDGGIYEQCSPKKYATGKVFGPNHTVGCGIDYAAGEYYFTLDGEPVGKFLQPYILT